MKKDRLTTHHRKCKSNGGTNHPSNLSFLPHSRHAAWHYLFGNLEAPQIVELINQLYLDPNWELTVKRKPVEYPYNIV